jgi:hypothetical protein
MRRAVSSARFDVLDGGVQSYAASSARAPCGSRRLARV